LNISLPSTRFEELVSAYRHDTIGRLSFSLDSELWEMADRPYEGYDDTWYLLNHRVVGVECGEVGGKLVELDWIEKKRKPRC